MLSVDLPAEPASATRARTLTRERLEPTCSADTIETVALLVTELVTNAILHARTPLLLTLETRPGHLRICVADRSNELPSPRHHQSDAITGRGLALVEQLSSAWGVDTTPSGKLVWCEVPVQLPPDVRT